MADDVPVHQTPELPLETIVEVPEEILPEPPVNVEVPEEVSERPPMEMIGAVPERVAKEPSAGMPEKNPEDATQEPPLSIIKRIPAIEERPLVNVEEAPEVVEGTVRADEAVEEAQDPTNGDLSVPRPQYIEEMPVPARDGFSISKYDKATDGHLLVLSSKRTEVEALASVALKCNDAETPRMLAEEPPVADYRVVFDITRICARGSAEITMALALSERPEMLAAAHATLQLDWLQFLKMSVGHPANAPRREVIINNFVRFFGGGIPLTRRIIGLLNTAQVHQELPHCPKILHDTRKQASIRGANRRGKGSNNRRARLLGRLEKLQATRPPLGDTAHERERYEIWKAKAIELNGDLKKENDRVEALQFKAPSWKRLALIDLPVEHPVIANQSPMKPTKSSDPASRPAAASSTALDSSRHKPKATTQPTTENQPKSKTNGKALFNLPAGALLAKEQPAKGPSKLPDLAPCPVATSLNTSRHNPRAKTGAKPPSDLSATPQVTTGKPPTQPTDPAHRAAAPLSRTLNGSIHSINARNGNGYSGLADNSHGAQPGVAIQTGVTWNARGGGNVYHGRGTANGHRYENAGAAHGGCVGNHNGGRDGVATHTGNGWRGGGSGNVHNGGDRGRGRARGRARGRGH